MTNYHKRFNFDMPMPDAEAGRRAEAAVGLLTDGDARIAWPSLPDDLAENPWRGSIPFPSPASLLRGPPPPGTSQAVVETAWRLANELLEQEDGRHALRYHRLMGAWSPGVVAEYREDERLGPTLAFEGDAECASAEGAAALAVGLCRAYDLPAFAWEWAAWTDPPQPHTCHGGAVVCSRAGVQQMQPLAWIDATLKRLADAEAANAPKPAAPSPAPGP